MDIGLGRTAATLESRFVDLDHPVLLTGIQALVRLLLEQARLDRAAGLHTGALLSGYRGSPLGGLDQELRFVRSDGTELWVAASLEQLEFRGEPAMIACLSDITDRKRAEVELTRAISPGCSAAT